MKIRLHLLIPIIALLLLFSSCTSDILEHPIEIYGTSQSTGPIELTEEELNEIFTTIAIINKLPSLDTSSFDIKCYGKEEGVYVCFIISREVPVNPVETSETVNYYTFNYPDSLTLSVCAYGSIYSLTEAYDEGILSKDLLAAVHSLYHPAPEGTTSERISGTPVSTGPVELSESELKKIVSAYLEGKPSADKDMSHYRIECYGKEDGVYIFFFDPPGAMYMQAIETYVIDGLYFYFSSSRVLRVYDGENFYAFNKAYSEEILTNSLLHTAHRNYHPGHYLEELSSFDLEMINSAWYRKHGKSYAQTVAEINGQAKVFYGKYDGAIVLMSVSAEEGASSEFVGGYEFHFPTKCELWICKNGRYYTLDEAFTEGHLGQEDLDKIILKHLAWLSEKEAR